jgi:hypothetical protein
VVWLPRKRQNGQHQRSQRNGNLEKDLVMVLEKNAFCEENIILVRLTKRADDDNNLEAILPL